MNPAALSTSTSEDQVGWREPNRSFKFKRESGNGDSIAHPEVNRRSVGKRLSDPAGGVVCGPCIVHPDPGVPTLNI